MAPASGSGPKERTPQRETSPPGWDRGPGLNIYQLNADHPDYPPEWRELAMREARARLDADDHVQAAITDLRDEWRERIDILAGLADDQIAATRWAQFTGDLAPLQVGREILYRLDLALRIAALDTNPGNVPIELLIAYIAEHTLPNSLHGWWSAPATPVAVIANADTQPVMTALYPGEVLVKISGGTAVRDVAGKLGPIITDAQSLVGQRKAKGGRRSRRDDPTKAERARAAAKLYHWRAWSYDEIAALFDWQDREIVRRFVRDGETLLADELGPGWETRPPAVIAERGC